MQLSKKVILIAALIAPLFSLQAQSVVSDFSSGSGWASPATLVGNTGTIQVSSNVGNYYTPASPTDSQFSYMQYTGATLSYDTSWSIRVDTNYAIPSSIFTSGSQQFINLGLMVTPGSETVDLNGVNPGFRGYLVSSNLFSTTSDTYNRGFETSLFSDGSAADGTEYGYNPSITGATFTSVMLSYDAGSQLLTASFDADTTNGHSFTSMPSQSVNANTLWGMSGSDTFSLYLFGNSGWDEAGPNVSPTIDLGEVTFDNLYGSGLSAIPEPSTYAAMAGVCALGLAVWRRRARGVAAV